MNPKRRTPNRPILNYIICAVALIIGFVLYALRELCLLILRGAYAASELLNNALEHIGASAVARWENVG